MSKKSYKRNQNRLYREIKRRITAEQRILKPVQFAVCKRSVETIKIKKMVPNYMIEHEEYVKQDMANQIMHTLIEDGFIVFHSRGFSKDFPVENIAEIEATLNVVRPWE